MIGEVSNHLWQSTLFAIAVTVLALALRRNQARIRYWLWFCASVKFVPFTLLMTFGGQLEWAPRARQITPPAVSSAVGRISQPLVVHEERREMPVYSLVMARADRRPGERLRPFDGECMEPDAVPVESLTPPWLAPTADPGKGPSPCMVFTGMGRLSATGTMLSALASTLARFPAVSRRVIDRTGLTGQFDFDLEWTPMVTPAGVPPPAVPNDRPSDAGPTIFTALQEQLGLRLESTREAVAVLVIDSVNQPTRN